MNKVLILVIFIVSSLFSFAGSYHAKRGEVDGGGADHPEYLAGSAWFLKGHKEQIDICMRIENDTNIEINDVKNQVTQIYKQWDKYIEDVVYDEDTEDDLKYVTKIAFTCHQPDLDIFIGEWDNEYLNKIKARFNYPIGLALREKKLEDKGWSKGLIWIGRDFKTPHTNHGNIWHRESNLYMILLHEIGHTFGNPHKANTIMKKNIVNDLIWWQRDDSDDDYYDELVKKQRKIDHEDTLTFCEKCLLRGDSGHMYRQGSAHEKIVFNKIIGRDPIGAVTTSYGMIPSNSSEVNKIQGVLNVKDSVEDISLNFELFPHDISMINTNIHLFNRVRVDSNYYRSSSSGGYEFSSMHGVIKTKDRSYSIMMEYNTLGFYFSPPLGEIQNDDEFVERYSPMNIYIIENGRKLHLFTKNRVWAHSSPSEPISEFEFRSCKIKNYFSL